MSLDPPPELRSDLFVQALVRRVEVGGAFAHVARRGDSDAGAVMVKVVVGLRQARLHAPARDRNGAMVHEDVTDLAGGPDEAAIDAYLTRRLRSDPDLWSVEIEDVKGRHFLPDPRM